MTFVAIALNSEWNETSQKNKHDLLQIDGNNSINEEQKKQIQEMCLIHLQRKGIILTPRNSVMSNVIFTLKAELNFNSSYWTIWNKDIVIKYSKTSQA